MSFTEYITDAQKRIKDVNVANGWYEETRPFSAEAALLHSEVSEMYEAYRSWGVTDETLAQCKLNGKHPTGIGSRSESSTLPLPHLCKPEGVGSELADIFIRLLDTCDRYDIDLVQEFERKLAYNATRGFKHGGKRE